jgi:hypothetical protein
MSDSKIIPKEPAYREKEKKAAKEGKKIPEYGAVYSSTLLFLTLGMFIIGVQTSVPSLKTRKTFPGCVRSFSGFPIEGEGDDSGLNYLSCVAYKMKSKTMPWDALARIKEEKLADTIKVFIVKYLMPYAEVEQKIKEKVETMEDVDKYDLEVGTDYGFDDEDDADLWDIEGGRRRRRRRRRKSCKKSRRSRRHKKSRRTRRHRR